MSTSETPRILSVEDNPETRLLLKHQLGEDYEVAFVSTAEEALSALDFEDIDLMLLDVHLGPGKSGTELLHLLRNREETAEIPAIALTAYAMPGEREDLLSEGFDEHLAKPYAQTELREVIDQALAAS